MRIIEFAKRAFGYSGTGPDRQQPIPHWKILGYSFGILAAFFAGTILEARFRFTGFGEALGALPVVVGAIFFLRLPPRRPIQVRWIWRLTLLALPFLPLAFADFRFPEFSADNSSVWTVLIVQALGVGVSEELTFRFGLHRIWSRYGALFYVIASSAIFAAGHYPLGLQVTIISGIIGASFAASRVAGMPLVALIALHAFFDMPEIFRTMSASALL